MATITLSPNKVGPNSEIRRLEELLGQCGREYCAAGEDPTKTAFALYAPDGDVTFDAISDGGTDISSKFTTLVDGRYIFGQFSGVQNAAASNLLIAYYREDDN